MNTCKQFFTILLFLLVAAYTAMAGTHTPNYYVAEHGDFRIGYEAGELELSIYLDAGTVVNGQPLSADSSFAPEELVVVATQVAKIKRPAGTMWNPTGVSANEALWVIPQHPDRNLPALGLSTHGIASGVFVNDKFHFRLRAIQGPGEFSLWEDNAFGQPAFYFATHWQQKSVILPVGLHAHYNWGFTAPGDYTLAFEVTAELVAGGTVSSLAFYNFKVTDAPLPMQSLAGDVNGDGTVDAHDLQIVEDNLGKSVSIWPVDSPDSPYDVEGIEARLLVADAETAFLSAVDLENGLVEQDAFELTARPTGLYASPGHRFAFSIETDGDMISIFDGGIYVEDHGSHMHPYHKPLKKMGLSLPGASPVHVVSRGGWSALHQDGAGKVIVINEAELAAYGDSYQPQEIIAGLQHGAAVPIGHDLFAVSMANPDYPSVTPNPLPIGADIWDLDGNILYSAPGCGMLHGEAGNGDSAAFGCDIGVMMIELTDTGFTHYLIPNPADMLAGARIGGLRAHDDLDHYFGHASVSGVSAGVFLVDPATKTMKLVVAGGDIRAIAYEFRPNGEEFLVLLSNGDLLVLDAMTGEVEKTAPGITSPIDNHEHHGQFHPDLAAGLGRIYVGDPFGSRIVELDAEDLTVLRVFPITGNPTKLVLLGSLDEHGHGGHDH